MKVRLIGSMILYLLCQQSFMHGQNDIKQTGKVKNPQFDKTIAALLRFNVPVLSVQEAKTMPQALYLDARESDEFGISHIPGALWIGSDHWNPGIIHTINKDQPLIVYCSVGYRSEKIAAKIKQLGHTHVYNLYGSIFEWANEGYPLESGDGKSTNKVHTYNKNWSKWVTNPAIEKIW